MTRRPRPQLVSLTDAAAGRLRELMADRGAGYLRVGVRNGGCAGMEYTLDYAEQPGALDERVKDRDVEILIEPAAILFLIGTVIDYEVTPLHAKFTFRNPNQTDACGCGESVSIQPAAAV